MIDLYTAETPNGWKISITLEELQLPYTVHALALSKNEQKAPCQMGGVGPMMGQANVFYRYAPEKIPYAIERYQREVRRLLEVLNGRLADHEYLADDYSIADIANWTWARGYEWSGDDRGRPEISRVRRPVALFSAPRMCSLSRHELVGFDHHPPKQVPSAWRVRKAYEPVLRVSLS